MPEAGLKTQPVQPDSAPLITLFDRCFADSLNTRLVRGFDEPVYLPATADCLNHRVIFAHGFFSSALHEIAHWCLAGEQRRQQIDYGYWYAPDGRSVQQQRDFEVVEVKPQALEWILSKSCGHRFRISADNLSGEATDPQVFKLAVFEQVADYCRQGLPARAETLRQALVAYYGVHSKLAFSRYSLTEL